jgi:anti-sigma factor ChrR (cupin superfamily)
MSATSDKPGCAHVELVPLYAIGSLTPEETRMMEIHVASCPECQEELEALRPVVDSLVSWPTDVLRPADSLRQRLAERIAQETGGDPVLPAISTDLQPEWEEVAPGISCKLLATDTDSDRVSMLVRLAPGIAYPPHTHAGVEELHLLDGELWIEDRKLLPGDYNRAEPGTGDQRVWSETGCTCLLITSARDTLRS